MNTSTDFGYEHYVSYISINRNSDSQKNVTKSTFISERLAGSYRNEWIEFEVNGTVKYNHARNALQPNSNLDTWIYSYGFNKIIKILYYIYKKKQKKKNIFFFFLILKKII